MPRVVISDTSCLIVLSKIDELIILKKLYNELIVTPEIAREFGENLPNWISQKAVNDIQKQDILEIEVDKGEASAIALSLEIGADLLIVDDFKARQVSKKLGLKITGTLGILVKAKLDGHYKSIKPVLSKLQTTNFRLSSDLINQVLLLADELD